MPQRVKDAAAAHRLGLPIFPDRNGYLFENGLVHMLGFSVILHGIGAIEQWSDAVDVEHYRGLNAIYDTAHGSVITQAGDVYKIRFKDKKSLKFSISQSSERTLASDYFRYGPRQENLSLQTELYPTASKHVWTVLAEEQQQWMRQALDQGESVNFGVLSATNQGITYANETYLWDNVHITLKSLSFPGQKDFARNRVYEKHREVILSLDKQQQELDARKIHNLGALLLLLKA